MDPVNDGAEHPGNCSLVVNCDLSSLLTTNCSSEMKHLQTNDNQYTCTYMYMYLCDIVLHVCSINTCTEIPHIVNMYMCMYCITCTVCVCVIYSTSFIGVWSMHIPVRVSFRGRDPSILQVRLS